MGLQNVISASTMTIYFTFWVSKYVKFQEFLPLFPTKWPPSSYKQGFTLPETNIAPENRPSQKETSIPTIDFQMLC